MAEIAPIIGRLQGFDKTLSDGQSFEHWPDALKDLMLVKFEAAGIRKHGIFRRGYTKDYADVLDNVSWRNDHSEKVTRQWFRLGKSAPAPRDSDEFREGRKKYLQKKNEQAAAKARKAVA